MSYVATAPSGAVTTSYSSGSQYASRYVTSPSVVTHVAPQSSSYASLQSAVVTDPVVVRASRPVVHAVNAVRTISPARAHYISNPIVAAPVTSVSLSPQLRAVSPVTRVMDSSSVTVTPGFQRIGDKWFSTSETVDDLFFDSGLSPVAAIGSLAPVTVVDAGLTIGRCSPVKVTGVRVGSPVRVANNSIVVRHAGETLTSGSFQRIGDTYHRTAASGSVTRHVLPAAPVTVVESPVLAPSPRRVVTSAVQPAVTTIGSRYVSSAPVLASGSPVVTSYASPTVTSYGAPAVTAYPSLPAEKPIVVRHPLR